MTSTASPGSTSMLDALLGAVRSLIGADVVIAFAWRDERTALVRAASPATPSGSTGVWPDALTLPGPAIDAAGGVHLEVDLPRRLVSNALRFALPAAPQAALVVTTGAADDTADDAERDAATRGGLLAIWHARGLDEPAGAELVHRVVAIRPALARALADDGARVAHDRLAARLAAIMATSTQAIVFVDDAAGGTVNDAAARLLGVSAGAVDPVEIAARMAELRAGAVNASTLEADARRLVTDPDARLEHWSWTFAAPAVRHLRVSSVPVRDGTAHTLRGRLWTFDDVTREHEAEREARASEARFRAAMAASPDACFLLETVRGHDGTVTDFVFTEVNAGAGALLGLPAGDLVGEAMCEMFPILRGSAQFAKYVAVADTGVLYEGEYRMHDPRSTAVWAWLQVVPLRGADGAGAGIAITARDITAAKRADGEARLVHDVTRVLGAASDAHAALGAALAAMCTATGVAYGEAWVPQAAASDGSVAADVVPGAAGPTLMRGPVWHAEDDARLRAFANATADSTFAPGVGLPGRAVAEGAPVWLPDVTTPGVNFPRAASARSAGIRGGFAVPVVADGRLVAVLAFHSRHAADFGPAELDLLTTVGTQVGAVVRQKLAEAALREREAELRLTQDAGGMRGWTLDLATDRLRLAAGTRHVVALDDPRRDSAGARSDAAVPDEVSGAAARARIHSDDRPRSDADLATALSDHEGRYRSTYRAPGPDGTLRWVRATGQVERDADGTARRIRGVSVDVTAEVELQRRAEASEAELRALFAAMRDVVLVYDAHGTYVQVMPTTPERPYRSLGGMVGRRVHDLMPGAVADRILATVHRVLATGTAQHLDYELASPGGPQWLSATGSPLGPDTVLWVARDVTAQKAAEVALAGERAFLNSVLNTLSECVSACDEHGRLTLFNRATRELHGVPEDGAIAPEDWSARYAVYLPDGVTPFPSEQLPMVRALATAHPVDDVAFVVAPAVGVHAGEAPRTLVANARVLRAPDGAVRGAVCVARDMTAQKAVEAALRESEARYRGVLENLSSLAVQLDRDARITFANDALLAATGWTRDEVLGAHYFDRFGQQSHPTRERFAHTIGAGLAADVRAHHESVIVTRGGDSRLVMWDNAVLRDARGEVVGLASIGRDVTEERHLAAERERLMRALEGMADQDELTGLLNRRGFVRMAKQERKSAARTGRLDGVCYVDLDRFKPINDTYGHAAGDAALRAVARVLRETMRGADFCARFGGDEFAVYALGITAAGGAHVLAERLRGALATHNRAAREAGRPYDLAFTVGVAEFAPGEDLDAAMARADDALYAAKPNRITRATS